MICYNLHPAQATVSPPSSESENLNKNVPVAYLVNISSASDFLMNPIMALHILYYNFNLIYFIKLFSNYYYPSVQGPLRCSLVIFITA